jgi:hypothetical protein
MNLNVFDISGLLLMKAFVWSMFCGVLLRAAKVALFCYVWRKYAVLLYFLLPVVLSVLVGVGRGKEVVNLWK